MLEQDDASTLSRNFQYHHYFVAARQEKMQSYLDAIQKLADIERETATTIRELQTLQTSLEQEVAQLQTERSERQLLIEQTNANLQSKGEELAKLEQDRDALQKVITQIEQQRALDKAREEKRLQDEQRRQAEQQAREQQLAQQQQQQQQQQHEADKQTAASTTTETPAYSTEDLLRLQAQSFTQRKGKLLWPTRGKLLQRFGDQRQGSITWDGLLIQAANGSDVHAVHGGRVMYADTLRGQGLLLVLDHGDNFMSLYAHNDVLLREPGEWVQPGEVIARVGNSGGEKESALYFEIRQNGSPINPLPWLKKQPQ